MPLPGAAAAWNQSLTLFCERQITDFGGIIRPTRWEMEKQDNFPANFPACLPPRASLPVSWGRSAPCPCGHGEFQLLGEEIWRKGMGRTGLEQGLLWTGQEDRAPFSSSATRRAPRTHFHPRRAEWGSEQGGLWVQSRGSKAELGAVVPFMAQDQLWEKLELVFLLQSIGGAVMSPSVLLGRWAVPLSRAEGTVGALQGGGSTQGRFQQQRSPWSSLWSNLCGWSHGWRHELCIQGLSPAPMFSCRAQ